MKMFSSIRSSQIIFALWPLWAVGCSFFGSSTQGLREERILNSPNFNGNEFENLFETKRSWTIGEYGKMFIHLIFGNESRIPDGEISVTYLDSTSFKSDTSGIVKIFWMGHSSTLIEIEGYRLLTDPVWSEQIYPMKVIGSRRFHNVPIRLRELPSLDAVLISHDHHDHLDEPTVIELARTGVNFYVPLGVGAHLESWGINPLQIFELDWWDSVLIDNGNLRLVATPSRHISGRGVSRGSNKTLWSTWVVSGKSHRVFFSGDTGYFPNFRDIGNKYGPFDFTLMAIGAYDQMWPDIHLTPEQAIDAHLLLRGAKLIPIHWGTFNLSFHDWFEPPERLVKEADAKNVKCLIPRPGEEVSSLDESKLDYWWREYTEKHFFKSARSED